MELIAIKARIETALPGATAEITDMGGGDHIHALVIADAFQGKAPLARHRMILDLFTKEINANDVHALQLKTLTTSEARAQGFLD